MKKYCDVGKHEVEKLWKARRRDPNTREIIQESCCQSCMKREPIKSKPKYLTEEEVQRKKELNVFFASQTLVMPNNCEECGHKLDKSSTFALRAQIAHILPKSIFKSVATHPQNKMFLCCFNGCYSHAKFDNGDAKTRQSMKVYDLAIERFRSFENELTEAEKIKANKYLGIQ